MSMLSCAQGYEQQIVAKLSEGKLPGEVVQLQAQGESFVGLYGEPLSDQPQGAVILLHHMGGHADWPQVIRPIRTQLPGSGWATLSIQMPLISPGEPLADYGKTVEQARARIDAGLDYLLSSRYRNIVLVGYSFGAALIADYLASSKRNRVKAFVGISMQTHPFLNPRLDLTKQLEKIAIPVLDIYGSRDFNAVKIHAKERSSVAKKAGNQYYHQRVIAGADHYFAGLEDVLIRQLRGWLARAAPGVQIRADEEFEPNTETDAQGADTGEQ